MLRSDIFRENVCVSLLAYELKIVPDFASYIRGGEPIPSRRWVRVCTEEYPEKHPKKGCNDLMSDDFSKRQNRKHVKLKSVSRLQVIDQEHDFRGHRILVPRGKGQMKDSAYPMLKAVGCRSDAAKP